jgi:hypothetical protein
MEVYFTYIFHLANKSECPPFLGYRIHGDEVQILRILHGRQDLRSIMRAETMQLE